MTKSNKTIEQLETDIISLKIRIRRIEDYLNSFPSPEDYFNNQDQEEHDLLKEALELLILYDKASASLIQRRLSVGYATAARLLDVLENGGFVSVADGSKPRKVFHKKIDKYLKEQELEKQANS